MLIPPSTASVAPVTNELSPPARNSTARAISSGVGVTAERDHLLEDRGRALGVLAGGHGLDPLLERVADRAGVDRVDADAAAAASFAAVRISPTSACLEVA